MAGWYVRRGEKVLGPVDLANLKEAVAAGKLLPTDQLAKDAAGPWTAASRTALFAKEAAKPLRPEAAPLPLVPKAEHPLVQVRPPDSDDYIGMIFRATKGFIVKVGRGTLAAGSGVTHFLSTRAQQRRELKLTKMQRQHELELARIQAQATAGSQRPAAPVAPPAPVVFAPQAAQNTVVNVVQRGGCGCSGCAWAIFLLLIALGVLGAILHLGAVR
jgi:hypothetical protein